MRIASVMLCSTLFLGLAALGGCQQTTETKEQQTVVDMHESDMADPEELAAVKAIDNAATSALPVLEGFVKTSDYKVLAYENRVEIYSGEDAPTVFDNLNREAFAQGVEYTSDEPGLEGFSVKFRDGECQDTNMVISIVIDGMSMQGCARVLE